MKRTCVNSLVCHFPALSENEGLARSLVAAFCALPDPTTGELADLRCAVSEAVTNAIVHGYRGRVGGTVYISARLYSDRTVCVVVRDRGCGIADIKEARMPLFTTDGSGERSGMGFAVMEAFCDRVHVRSTLGKGTVVTLEKRLSGTKDE